MTEIKIEIFRDKKKDRKEKKRKRGNKLLISEMKR
jgi:hypothetical protein